MSPHAAAPEPGSRPRLFGGRFRTVRLLKAGHGVETLLGADVETDAPVVIKTTPASHVSIGVQQRLEHEGFVLRAVRSPWLTPLLGLGHEADQFYLVMPFVPGVTLAERLASGRLPARAAITVGRCVLSALQVAHDRGVLHRDVITDPALRATTGGDLAARLRRWRPGLRVLYLSGGGPPGGPPGGPLREFPSSPSPSGLRS
jgi:hypothetical protein